MNALAIRHYFHINQLYRQHKRPDTLVVNELGLDHGKYRADIAVINGEMIGYEIKSNEDSLVRLRPQIKSYNSVFDKSYVIVGNRFINEIGEYIPAHWGIYYASKISKSAIGFNLIRKARLNKSVRPILLARLLWRNEAIDLLMRTQLPSKELRKPRESLYKFLVELFSVDQLKRWIRIYLRKRRNWRSHERLFGCGDWCQPVAKS